MKNFFSAYCLKIMRDRIKELSRPRQAVFALGVLLIIVYVIFEVLH